MKRRSIVVCIVLLAAAAAFLGYKYYLSVNLPINQAAEEDSEFHETIAPVRPSILQNVDKFTDKSTKTDIDKFADKSQLALVKELNTDSVGWIYIPDTNIDYPIMQRGDNDFYLHNGADGEPNNDYGCPFLDYRCDSSFAGFNSIVYGHNMIDRLMFADVTKYSDEEYLKEHDKGYLVLDDGVHTVNFFAYLSVPSTAAAYHTVFLTEQERSDYIDYIFTFAKFTHAYTADDLKTTDGIHLLLLSTCSFEYDESRGVLLGFFTSEQ